MKAAGRLHEQMVSRRLSRSGHPFHSDGVHLNAAGVRALTRALQEDVLEDTHKYCRMTAPKKFSKYFFRKHA